MIEPRRNKAWLNFDLESYAIVVCHVCAMFARSSQTSAVAFSVFFSITFIHKETVVYFTIYHHQQHRAIQAIQYKSNTTARHAGSVLDQPRVESLGQDQKLRRRGIFACREHGQLDSVDLFQFLHISL
jgi:hypothetical protein